MYSRIIVCSLSLIIPGLLFAESSDCLVDSEVANLFDRMRVGHQTTRYAGTVLYEWQKGRQFVSVIWPQEDGRGELKFLNSHVKAEKAFWPPPFSKWHDACDLSQVYSLTVESGGVVSGIATQRLTLRPRDTLRFGHVVDLDPDSGIPLRALTLDLENKLLERFEFAEITISPLSASYHDNSDSLISTSSEIIPGYFRINDEKEKGILVVGDGFSVASVFVEPLPAGVPLGEGAVLEGATLIYSRGVFGLSGAVLISVMGEIPLVTARLLADTVRPAQIGS